MKKKLLFAAILLIISTSFAGCLSTVVDAVTKDLTRGDISDNVYTSQYSGLTFTAPDDWQYASDEEIASLMGISADKLNDSESGTKFNEELLEKMGVYDMLVYDSTTESNVIIMYENLAISGGLMVNEEKYLNVLKEQLDSTQTYDDVFTDITDEEVCGETYKVGLAELKDLDALQYFYVRKLDKYMVGIIVTVAGGDDVSDIMDNFS